jgi:thiol-disulfide isomerase/thioredoxin
MRGELAKPAALRVLRDGREVQVEPSLASYPLKLPALPAPPRVGGTGPGLELDFLRADYRLPKDGSRLLFFWATWCGPCKAALPEVVAFGERRSIPVVAITDETPEDVEKFLSRHDGPFPEIVATDRHRTNFQSYGVSGTPTFVLVDAQGVVRHYKTGYKKADGLGIDGWHWGGTPGE